tara:strand:+ start:571 stop:1335 length:765 start_codon:yes stop_codon:yes gene_type:complete
MTINNKNFFELSARRDKETGNLIKESFFNDTETYEETSQDGSYYSKEETTVKGSGFIKKFFEKSSEDGLEEEQSLTERVLSIGVPDIIEHQDQILEEIHKIDGFENVTIDDVLNGTTGLPKDQLFNIMFNSDASMATGKKKDSGTDGYGKDEVEPTQFVMGSDELVTKTKENFEVSGEKSLVNPDEVNMLNEVAASINQSVNNQRSATVIQPVINNVQVPTPVSQPTPFPIRGKSKVIAVDLSRNKNLLAKSIK